MVVSFDLFFLFLFLKISFSDESQNWPITIQEELKETTKVPFHFRRGGNPQSRSATSTTSSSRSGGSWEDDERKIRVWFMRHGQAMHNIADCHICFNETDLLKKIPLFDTTRIRGSDDQVVHCEDCYDPSLTPVGRNDILSSRQRLRNFLSGQEGRPMNTFATLMYFDRIHFSPLSRAIDSTGILFFENWNTSENVLKDLQLPPTHNSLALLDHIDRRFIPQPLVQEVGAGEKPWETGSLPATICKKFSQFPHCCKNLPENWMIPKIDPKERVEQFTKEFITPQIFLVDGIRKEEVDIFVVAHYKIIREFLPLTHFENGEIQLCEYDKKRNMFRHCLVI